jgi:predicted  nucleic acid-binding Zn-ribbon protein
LDIAHVHNQSWPLLRKRDVHLEFADLERPADDPRELTALRHNLTQAQREIETLQAKAAGDVAAAEEAGREALETQRREFEHGLEELRRSYERSLSWQLTRPLRAGKRALSRRYRT